MSLNRRHLLESGAKRVHLLVGSTQRKFWFGSAVVATVVAGCVDNATHPEVQPWLPSAGLHGGVACVPNQDGAIAASEMAPILGATARFRIAGPRPVDLGGVIDANGLRTWDWSWSAAAEPGHLSAVRSLADQWYAKQFAQAGGTLFAAPFDVGPEFDAVYRHDEGGVWLLGLASRTEHPSAGQTLLRYEAPVLTVKAPLVAGLKWSAQGAIKNGILRGLPYAGTDSYDFEVVAAGKLTLPDLTVAQALQLRALVTAQSVYGTSAARSQASFVAECVGEIARATAAPPGFPQASEVRRLAL